MKEYLAYLILFISQKILDSLPGRTHIIFEMGPLVGLGHIRKILCKKILSLRNSDPIYSDYTLTTSPVKNS